MSVRAIPSISAPDSTDRNAGRNADRLADLDADRLLADLLEGPFEPETRRLLITASGGDPALLRVLVLTGLGVGDLARHDGYWRWSRSTSRLGRLTRMIESRAAGFSRTQAAAMRTLTETWALPKTLVERLSGGAESGTDPAGETLGLTRREKQILELIADGLTAEAIGRRLRVSPRTVAKHQERMYRKLGTSDRLTTVLRAQRLGLLPALAPTA